jgi:hypothetical protein
MRTMFRLATLSLSALALSYCGCEKAAPKQVTAAAAQTAEPPADHVVAMVNATPLTWGDMNKRAMGYMKDDIETNHLVIPSNRVEEAKDYFRRRAINAFVFKTVMMDEAVRQNIRVSEADRQMALKSLALTLKSRNWTTNDFFNKGPMDPPTMRREFEDGMVIDKLLKLNVRSKIKVDAAEIDGFTATLMATNNLKRAKLETVRKQLLEGANFEDVAKTVSEDPSAKKGGDLGEFGRGKLVKPLEDAAFSQEVGVIGPIIESRFGYHIVKVTAHAPARKATASTPAIPETVRASHILLKTIPVDKARINDTLLKSKFNKGVQEYFAELKAKAKIECYLFKDMTF